MNYLSKKITEGGGGAHPIPKHGGGGRKNGWAMEEEMRRRDEKTVKVHIVSCEWMIPFFPAFPFNTIRLSGERVYSGRRRREVSTSYQCGRAEHACRTGCPLKKSLIFWFSVVIIGHLSRHFLCRLSTYNFYCTSHIVWQFQSFRLLAEYRQELVAAPQ